MTVEAYSILPFQAGGAVATAAGRAAMWAISAYMRQPLRNTAIAALVGLSAMAGSNALYKQAHHHPAPLFGSFSADKPAPATAPIMPVERPLKLAQPISTETTGSVDPAQKIAPVIGNGDVIAMQQKLATLKFFDGKADGLFGPRTARAIKAFETSVGRTPKGVLSQQIIDLIAAAQVPVAPVPVAPAPIVAAPAPAIVAPLASASSQPSAAPVLSAEPIAPAAAEPSKPLPAPLPLASTPAAPPQVAVTTPAPLALATPTVTSTTNPANNAINSLVDGVQTMAMTKPNTIAARPVQTIAVRATVAPAQAMPAALVPETDSADIATNPTTVASVQRGLNSLGFLHGEISGVADEATSKAIRNFQVYYNYDDTGRITPELVKLLVQNGAAV